MPVSRRELEEIIRLKSEEFANSLLAAADRARTEADIRSATDRLLATVESSAGIRLDPRHEFTVASGRIDSVYDRVIVEYKNPNSVADRIGSTLDAGGSRRLLDQIKSRFVDLQNEAGQPINSLFGVGIDGRKFIFVRFREGRWIEEPPVPITQTSSTRFLWALFNLGTAGKPFIASYLASDFGSRSRPAVQLVNAMYASICSTADSKAGTLFSEWQLLFGMVCGYDSLRSSRELTELADLYQINDGDNKALDFPKLLYCTHTYFAVFMKFLAAEIVSFYHHLPSVTQKCLRTATSQALLREMMELEAGGVFQHLGIRNFLEGDLFSWYISAWNEDIRCGIMALISQLDSYNFGTLSEDPTESRDLLKDLYLEIIPREIRHSLGEYYTPDWVADLVFEQIDFTPVSNKRILDPACGSGTFLVIAISRLRREFEQHREEMHGGEATLLRNILANVVGFDLNPLAVLASRTNYLIAIRDLVAYVDEVELPIYLADSVATPAEYGDLFTGSSAVAKVPCAGTRPPFLNIPKEVGQSTDAINKFTGAIEHSLNVNFSSHEFIEECREAGITIGNESNYVSLFDTLKDLKATKRDGIWIRIIKNAFAPLFVGKFDYIVGNPPWINWESLPPEYREISSGIWEQYGLTGQVPGRRRQASDQSKTDISILMTYVAADKYGRDGSWLGFVLPRTIFQTELGGWHFRRFSIPSGRALRVRCIQDIDALKPFRGQAANTSCIAILEIGAKTQYPVSWCEWRPTDGSIATSSSLEEVKRRSRTRDLIAEPIAPEAIQSPWIIGSKRGLVLLRRLLGPSFYFDRAREGINTRGANGIFFVDAWIQHQRMWVKNRPQDGRMEGLEEKEAAIEADYLFPLLRGENVAPYCAAPASFVILPHSGANPSTPVPFRSLPKKTREFLAHFENRLRSRRKFRNFDPSGPDWYGLYSVLNATFSPHKVIWREMASGLIAAAVSSTELPNKDKKVVIPDHKLFIIPCESAQEADFVSGFMNSDAANFIVASYAVGTGVSTHILERVPIPRFDLKNELHKKIASKAASFRKGSITPQRSSKDHKDLSACVCLVLGLEEKLHVALSRELAELGFS